MTDAFRDGGFQPPTVPGGLGSRPLPRPMPADVAPVDIDRLFDRELAPPERSRLLTALRFDRETAAEVRDIDRALQGLRASAPAPDVTERVLARLDGRRRFLPQRMRSRVRGMRALAATLLLFGVFGVAVAHRLSPGVFRLAEEPAPVSSLSNNIADAAAEQREAISFALAEVSEKLAEPVETAPATPGGGERDDWAFFDLLPDERQDLRGTVALVPSATTADTSAPSPLVRTATAAGSWLTVDVYGGSRHVGLGFAGDPLLSFGSSPLEAAAVLQRSSWGSASFAPLGEAAYSGGLLTGLDALYSYEQPTTHDNDAAPPLTPAKAAAAPRPLVPAHPLGGESGGKSRGHSGSYEQHER